MFIVTTIYRKRIFNYFKLTCKKHNCSMFSGNNFNLLLVTISSDRVRVLRSRPEINCPLMAGMLVARIESRDPETVEISSNTKVSGPRPVPPESCRPVPNPKSRVPHTLDDFFVLVLLAAARLALKEKRPDFLRIIRLKALLLQSQ